jgi:type IX secretion system PorP/SprF family membrane protein
MEYLAVKNIKNWMFIFLMSISNQLFAQIYPQSSHYMWNPQFENPALSGSKEGIRTTANFRYQWTGFTGAPITTNVGADMPLPLKNSGGGILLQHDRTGAYSFTALKFSYAYTQNLGSLKLSAGFNAGLVNAVLDGSKLTTPQGDFSGNNPNLNDDYLSTEKMSSFRPDLGLGIALRNDDFFVGVSVSNLANFSNEIKGTNASFSPDFGRYFTVHGGVKFPLGQKFSIEPNFLLKSDLNNWQTDISVVTTYNNLLSFGLGVRGYNNKSLESLLALVRIRVMKGMNFGYSYDANLGVLNQVSNGSHEISLSYLIPKKWETSRGKVVNHPRFL